MPRLLHDQIGLLRQLFMGNLLSGNPYCARMLQKPRQTKAECGFSCSVLPDDRYNGPFGDLQMRHIQHLAHLPAELKSVYLQTDVLLFRRPQIGPCLIKLLLPDCPKAQRIPALFGKLQRRFRRKLLPDPSVFQQHIAVGDSLQIP